MSKPELVVVTTVFNNPEELHLTTESISAQVSQPDRWLFLDSSDEPFAGTVQQDARECGAEYLWCPPQGVYPAMNTALNHLPDDSWVWFINSSDWLAGPRAIGQVQKALEIVTAEWLIGILVRRQTGLSPAFRAYPSGAQFAESLRRGKTGFPHPASIMKTASLLRLGGFDESLRVAADFDLALHYQANFGPPELVPEVVAVQEAGGMSSRLFFRNILEQSQALTRSGQWISPVNVVLFSLGRALTRISRRLSSALGTPNSPWGRKNRPSRAPRPEDHFCDTTGTWPECCRHYLALRSRSGRS